MRLLCVLVLTLSLPLLAAAQDSQRARLAAERRSLGERFAAEERACAGRFAVTACVDETRARRREALAPLRERELRLEEAERRQRATMRRAAIAAKVAAAASRPADAASAAASSALPEVRMRAPASGPSGALRAPTAKDDEVGRAAQAAQAAQRVREAQARQLDAQATQQRIQRRLTDRAAKGQHAEPLPVPARVPSPASSPRR